MAQPAAVDIGSRDKILDAAESLFARRGFAGIGLREVAEVAGLGKSSLFHHFRSKAELYAAVVGRILDVFEARLARALATSGGPLARFDRWLDLLIDTFVEYPTSARLLLRSLFEDDDLTGASEEEQQADRTLKRILAALADLLREGMEAGLFRPASIPHTVQSLVGMTVFHFASGEFGEELVGESLFSAAAVRRRKREVKVLLRWGLVADAERKSVSRTPREQSIKEQR
jgi:TetR/AcrR family transcriptional regulator